MTTGVGIEDQVAATWLNTVLTAGLSGNPGGVWDGEAPSTAERPLTRFTMQSAITVRGVGYTEIMVNMLWVVRGVCEGTSFLPLVPIAAQIQSLLHGVQDAVVSDPSGWIVTSSRADPYRLQGVEGGRQWRELGGIYRIFVQGT